MARHAFVSYSRTDASYVGELVAWLANHDVPVWSDSRIVYGSEWPAVVRDAVDGAAVVVVVMSPEAEASEWVDRELARAGLRGLPVVPLLLAGDPFFRLGSTHYEDVRGGHMPSEGLATHVFALCHTPEAPSGQSTSAIDILDPEGNVVPRSEPFTAQLMARLESLMTRDHDPFLILERPEDTGYWAQAYFNGSSNSFTVEYCDGGLDQHYGAETDNVVVAAKVLAGWADRTEGWSRPLEWTQVPPS